MKPISTNSACQYWVPPDTKWSNVSELARYGHSAVVAGKDRIFVIGGFNGTMRENIYEFKPGIIESFVKKYSVWFVQLIVLQQTDQRIANELLEESGENLLKS